MATWLNDAVNEEIARRIVSGELFREDAVNELQETIENLEARIAKKDAALAIFADSKNWYWNISPTGKNNKMEWQRDEWPSNIATAALES